MQVYCMYADGGAGPGGKGHHLHDDKTLASRVARMVDTLEHFPMADGAVMDGPEWGYEIAPHHMNHRSYFFHDLPESVAPMAEDLGTTMRPWWPRKTGSCPCSTTSIRCASADTPAAG